MSQDAAIQNASESTLIKALEELRPLIEDTMQPDDEFDSDIVMGQLDQIISELDQDQAHALEASDLLFGEDIAGYGDRCSAVFARWQEPGQSPTLVGLIALAWEKLGLEVGTPLHQAALLAAVMGEVPNTLQYHGNDHYRKVLFHVIRMIVTHNALQADSEWILTPDEMILLLVAGTIHDLGHEGGDNLRDGVYTPGYMEQKAFDLIRPYCEALDIDRDFMGNLETLVFCTDITFFAGDNSPCVRMRRIYDYYFVDDSDDKVLNLMMGKLRRFDENPRLALMAMLLHEADIGSSAGLSYEQSVRETINIIEERGLESAGPRTLLAFLQEQLGGSMKTEAADKLFGPAMDAILEQAARDMQRGRETYYQD